jgi:hypothetical protein
VSTATSTERRPPEGYGVTPLGGRFQPVKWAPQHGEGAYHPLAAADERGGESIPKTCASLAEAVDWLHEQLAPRQASLLGDAAAAPVAPKREKRRDRRAAAPVVAAASPAPEGAAPKKNPGATGKHWKWGDGKRRKAS